MATTPSPLPTDKDLATPLITTQFIHSRKFLQVLMMKYRTTVFVHCAATKHIQRLGDVTDHFSLTFNQSEGLVFFLQEVPVDINAPNVVLKLQIIPTLGRGRRKQFYVILFHEVPENASDLVLKLQMLLTPGNAPQPPPKPTPAWRSRR